MTDSLNIEIIREHLASTSAAGIPLDVFDSTGSTNDVCKEHAEANSLDDFYVAVAGHQSRGRGRKGRAFQSPTGTGLYMSLLIRPDKMPVEDSLKLTTMAAVATSEAIESVAGKHPGIKWVNDLYLDGRKICGILTEATFKQPASSEAVYLDYAIVGIGINVYDPEGGFAPEIRDVAGSIMGNDIRPNLRSHLAAELIARFNHYYSNAMDTAVEEYKNRCIVPGRQITVMKPGQPGRTAQALMLDDDLRLLVVYEDGEEEWLMSGEISTKL